MAGEDDVEGIVHNDVVTEPPRLVQQRSDLDTSDRRRQETVGCHCSTMAGQPPVHLRTANAAATSAK